MVGPPASHPPGPRSPLGFAEWGREGGLRCTLGIELKRPGDVLDLEGGGKGEDGVMATLIPGPGGRGLLSTLEKPWEGAGVQRGYVWNAETP